MTDSKQGKENSTGPSKVSLSIDGMSCAGCAITIETKLKRLSGVIDATVSLTTGTATIKYDPGSVELDDIRKAIISAGYQVGELSKDEVI